MNEEEEEIEIEKVTIDEIFVDGRLVMEKITVEIEGKHHPWEGGTITAKDVAELGGWAVAEGVLIIDADNNDRVLAVHEVVEIEAGFTFAKRVKFRRG